MLGGLFDRSVRLLTNLIPRAEPLVGSLVHRAKLFRRATYYLHDFRVVRKYMRWHSSERDLKVIESEIFFQYHKIEKGMTMPGPKRFFGMAPVLRTLELLHEWLEQGGSPSEPVFAGAVEALYAYRDRVSSLPALRPDALELLRAVTKFLAHHPGRNIALSTPYVPPQVSPEHLSMLRELMMARRSIRSYTEKPVPLGALEEAIALAQMSPSACNRQPWRVHVYRERNLIDSLLSLQSGNAGFGHLLNTLLVVTADAKAFFDGSERNEPFVDGGLFSMSLILALQAQGLSSCCLNWCVKPNIDVVAHRVGRIDDSERIIMYLAVGYSEAKTEVPRSVRKSTGKVLVLHA